MNVKGAIHMVCGSKRYYAKVKYEGTEYTEPVSARTPAEARKAIRRKYGKEAEIIAVHEQKGPNRIRM